MRTSLPFDGACPAMAGFANDNDGPGLGSAPKGVAGLALCCEVDEAGGPVALIRPVMPDGRLGAPLYIARDGADIVALWRGFGQRMNLPLFIGKAGGPLEAFGLAPGAITHPRRGGSPLSGRRTRFARRRKPPLRLHQQALHRRGAERSG